MSHSTVCNTTVSTKKTLRTLASEISPQVACNAACVQRKRSCKHEGEICLCKQLSVGMGTGVWHHQPNLQWTATCVCVMVALREVL